MVSLSDRRKLVATRRDYLRVVGNELTRPRRVALYARVSTDEQVEKKSIQPQLDLLEGLAQVRQQDTTEESDRVTVVSRIVDDGVSGAKPLTERPDGRRLISMVCARSNFACRGECGGGGAEIDEVWAAVLDRVARKLQILMDIHTFLEAHDVRLIIDKPHIDTRDRMGRLLFQILGAIAEWERDTIAERTATGRRQKSQDGKWKGGLLPFWLVTDDDANIVVDDRLIERVQMTASALILDIAERVINGETTPDQEAARLTALGVPLALTPSTDDPSVLVGRPNNKTRADGVWRSSHLRDLLHNPKLCGYGSMNIWVRDANGKRVKDEHGEYKIRETIEYRVPPIMSESQYDDLQRAIDANNRGPSPHANRTYLLSGLIHCGRPNCGYFWAGFTAKQHEHVVQTKRFGPRVRPAGTWSYYYCGAATKPSQELPDGFRGCRGKGARSGIRAEELEGAVWAVIERFLRNPDSLLDEAQRRVEEREADVPAREARLAQIIQRCGELAQEHERTEMMFQKGRRNLAKTEEEFDRIDDELATLGRERFSLESGLRLIQSMRARLKRSGTALAEYRETIESGLSDEDKRFIIQRLVPDIVVLESGRRWKAKMVLDLGSLVDRELNEAVAFAGSDGFADAEGEAAFPDGFGGPGGSVGADAPGPLKNYRLWRAGQDPEEALALDLTLGPGA